MNTARRKEVYFCWAKKKKVPAALLLSHTSASCSSGVPDHQDQNWAEDHLVLGRTERIKTLFKNSFTLQDKNPLLAPQVVNMQLNYVYIVKTSLLNKSKNLTEKFLAHII